MMQLMGPKYMLCKPKSHYLANDYAPRVVVQRSGILLANDVKSCLGQRRATVVLLLKMEESLNRGRCLLTNLQEFDTVCRLSIHVVNRRTQQTQLVQNEAPSAATAVSSHLFVPSKIYLFLAWSRVMISEKKTSSCQRESHICETHCLN